MSGRGGCRASGGGGASSELSSGHRSPVGVPTGDLGLKNHHAQGFSTLAATSRAWVAQVLSLGHREQGAGEHLRRWIHAQAGGRNNPKEIWNEASGKYLGALSNF